MKYVSAREPHRLVSRPIFYKTYGTVGNVTDAYIQTIKRWETTPTGTNERRTPGICHSQTNARVLYLKNHTASS